MMTDTQRWIVLLVVYSLFALIGLGALGAVLGFFPNANKSFEDFAIVTLFADIAAAAITVFKTNFGLDEYRVFVSLVFDGKSPADVSLTTCHYQVRDGNNALKKEGEALVARGPGGWLCSFPIVPGGAGHDYARLELTEQNNTVWHVRNFSVNNLTMQAERVS